MFSRSRTSRAYYTPLKAESTRPQRRSRVGWCRILESWREAVIIGLCILCAFLTSELTSRPLSGRDEAGVRDAPIRSNNVHWTQFQWHTDVYSSADPSKAAGVDAAWDRIVPAFGLVAVEHDWAAKYHLPASMSLPSDSSKGVYIIDAYHQLHCLTIIRKSLVEIMSGQTPSKPVEHAWHCFDSLLQYIMCGTTGDTLLYTWGRNETGDGQVRQCIDWNSRKKWAKANTACYRDADHPIPLNDHFGHCENEDDGIGTW